MENKPSLFNRLDAYLIDKAQSAYLWVFDWTGVYVATLAFLSIATPMVLGMMRRIQDGSYSSPAFAGFLLVLNGLFLMRPYLLQERGEHDIYNMIALFARHHWLPTSLRWFLICLGISGMMHFTLRGQYVRAVAEIGWVTYVLLVCVMIREREPREFWKPAPRLAEVRSS